MISPSLLIKLSAQKVGGRTLLQLLEIGALESLEESIKYDPDNRNELFHFIEEIQRFNSDLPNNAHEA